jgi:uncharacterized integral membrane protein
VALIVFGFGVIAGMAVLIFAFENQEPIALRYLTIWHTPALPLFVIIMLAVGAGFVIAGLFGLAAWLRQRRTIRQQRRTIANLHAELQNLRNLPLDAPSNSGSTARAIDLPLSAAGESPR